jgi:Zn-dependent peptidase ImmA (M78 family)
MSIVARLEYGIMMVSNTNMLASEAIMIRTQVQLEEQDLKALRQLAAEQGVSISALVRQSVKHLLEENQKPTREELWERASSVIGKYRSGKTDIGQRHDDYLAEDFD